MFNISEGCSENKHVVLSFILLKGLQEMIHLFHTLHSNNRLTCFLPSLHFSSARVLGQGKNCTHSSSPPALLQVEVAVVQIILQLCPLLLRIFCLWQNSISQKYFSTSAFFFFSAKQAAMSPRGCGRSYLPKTMALFLILEFAVAQRRPLMRMEIHFYTNQM